MTGCTSGGYDQLETSPETIDQELPPAVCERRQTDLWRIIVRFHSLWPLCNNLFITFKRFPTTRDAYVCFVMLLCYMLLYAEYIAGFGS